jgi:hypothetical protein
MTRARFVLGEDAAAALRRGARGRDHRAARRGALQREIVAMRDKVRAPIRCKPGAST